MTYNLTDLNVRWEGNFRERDDFSSGQNAKLSRLVSNELLKKIYSLWLCGGSTGIENHREPEALRRQQIWK